MARPHGPYRYCPYCAASLELRGATEARMTCPQCGFVQFRNPVAGVAVILRNPRGDVLLGRRARGPYTGQWCIPCGYVEWDEDVREAARRELREETGLEVETGAVAAVHSNFHNEAQHTVGIWFAGEVRGGTLAPADGELTELRYCDPASPPDLAFPTDALVLQQLAVEAAR